MLPERLSNHICSLNPSEDKLTYSAVFELNDKSEVMMSGSEENNYQFDKRFSYSEAQKVIDAGDGAMKDEVLLLFTGWRSKLRAKRFALGGICF